MTARKRLKFLRFAFVLSVAAAVLSASSILVAASSPGATPLVLVLLVVISGLSIAVAVGWAREVRRARAYIKAYSL